MFRPITAWYQCRVLVVPLPRQTITSEQPIPDVDQSSTTDNNRTRRQHRCRDSHRTSGRHSRCTRSSSTANRATTRQDSRGCWIQHRCRCHERFGRPRQGKTDRERNNCRDHPRTSNRLTHYITSYLEAAPHLFVRGRPSSDHPDVTP